MEKLVKITVSGMPITCISTPLTRGVYGPLMMDTNDIFKCLVAGATVCEILADRKEYVLSLSNYEIDHMGSKDEIDVPVPPVSIPEPKKEIAVEIPVVTPTPPVEIPSVEAESEVSEETVPVVAATQEHWTAPVITPPANSNRGGGKNNRK